MAADASQTMIANLAARTGRSLPEWRALVRESGATTHGAIVTLLRTEHGLTHGYANLVAMAHLGRLDADPDALVEAQYAGAKAALRPIYEAILGVATSLGDDVQIAPKKTGVSLRRSKQFALIEPATRTRIDLGLNLKGTPPTERLRAAGGMCTHKVALTSTADVDDELRGWLRAAYQLA